MVLGFVVFGRCDVHRRLNLYGHSLNNLRIAYEFEYYHLPNSKISFLGHIPPGGIIFLIQLNVLEMFTVGSVV